MEDYRSVNSAISKQTNVRASEEKTLASRLLRACAMEHRARNTVKIMKNSLANGQRAFERVFFFLFLFLFFSFLNKHEGARDSSSKATQKSFHQPVFVLKLNSGRAPLCPLFSRDDECPVSILFAVQRARRRWNTTSRRTQSAMSFANEKQEVLVNRENGGEEGGRGEERKIAEKIFTKRKRMLEWKEKEKEEKEGSVDIKLLGVKLCCDNSLFFVDSFFARYVSFFFFFLSPTKIN